MKCKTIFKKSVINPDIATDIYNLLKWNIEWVNAKASTLNLNN